MVAAQNPKSDSDASWGSAPTTPDGASLRPALDPFAKIADILELPLTVRKRAYERRRAVRMPSLPPPAR